MAKRNINIEDLLNDGLTIEQAKNVFNEVILTVENENYKQNLSAMFLFALEDDPSLFTMIKIEETQSLIEECNEYVSKWCKKYCTDRENPALQRPLKNYGERDSALLERVAVNTGVDKTTLENYIVGHFIYMSAENMNGSILEEYLAEVLEEYGWIWCAGSTFRAVDFCLLNPENIILLQIKNKYNTENSSSSAIRLGTEIKKWNRLQKPRAATGKYNPIPNWKTLVELIGAESELAELLSEEKYLEYIRLNSTKGLATLD